MSEITLYLLGALGAIVVFFLLNRRVSEHGKHAYLSDPDDMEGVRGSTNAVPLVMLAGRIFSIEDWESLHRGAPTLKRAFLEERTKLALQWLDRARAQTSMAYYAFLSNSRLRSDVNLRCEFKTAASYVYFLLNWQVTSALVSILGPFRAIRAYENLVDASESMRHILGSMPVIKNHSPIPGGK